MTNVKVNPVVNPPPHTPHFKTPVCACVCVCVRPHYMVWPLPTSQLVPCSLPFSHSRLFLVLEPTKLFPALWPLLSVPSALKSGP